MVTCIWQGRCGNNFYQAAMAYAYALKHGMEFQVPAVSYHCDNNIIYFPDLPFKKNIIMPPFYEEPTIDGIPFYEEIPPLENVTFRGYWQSFKYIDGYRTEILKAFNIPYNKINKIGIHVRRGDYLIHSDAFPPLSLKYYENAIKYLQSKGYNEFLVFSDDIPYCKEQFTPENFPGCNFSFSEGKNELEDLSLLSSCEHQIVANSSFSFVASWLNQNPNKIVLCPTKDNLFKGANLDMIPDTYIQVENA